MASLYSICNRVWRTVPSPLRQWAGSLGGFQALRGRLARSAPHDHLYTREYYQTVEAEALRSVQAISRSILTDLRPASVLDVGCGTGVLLSQLQAGGVRCRGLEYSSAGLQFCRERGLDVTQFDLETDAPDGGCRVDTVISTEVGEHLPETVADRYVDLLCRAGDTVVFTAATPGQGGWDHVNEQPHAYWIAKFRARGFDLDEPLSLAWRKSWEQADVASFYWMNLMIFRRRPETQGEGE